MANFSDRVKELRKARGMTQRQVADALGITERSYQRYEAENNPNHETLMKLADYFDVSLDYLTGRVNYWHDAKGRITVKVPPDILNLDTEALKKQLDQD